MQSLKDFHTVLRCDDRQLKKLGRRLSKVVIKGLMEMWRQSVQRMSHERRVGEAREGERVAEVWMEMEMEKVGKWI
jgi:hypothetical protein